MIVSINTLYNVYVFRFLCIGYKLEPFMHMRRFAALVKLV